jgi:hypothetical protein
MELTERTFSANENRNIYTTYHTLTPLTDAQAYLQHRQKQHELKCLCHCQQGLLKIKKRHERTKNVENHGITGVKSRMAEHSPTSCTALGIIRKQTLSYGQRFEYPKIRTRLKVLRCMPMKLAQNRDC